jgi:hypothetical protein
LAWVLNKIAGNHLGFVQANIRFNRELQVQKSPSTVEAVTWVHALEEDEGPRKGQRVVIYPKEVSQLETVLSTGDPNVDEEDCHTIAYTKLLQAS